MMKADILFSAAGRPEFTAASLRALRENTDWDRVSRLWMYIENAADEETRRIMARFALDFPFDPLMYEMGDYGGPVAVMNDYIAQLDAGPLFAKIDNDVIVPPGWLDAALDVMHVHRDLDLLGIEPPLSRTPAPWATKDQIKQQQFPDRMGRIEWKGYGSCDAIGGVGLMRKRAFLGRDRMLAHSTYGGFTDWQLRHPEVVKGWIVPPLSLFVLDRLPIEPWASLSKRYIEQGHQRPWTNYGPEAAALWEWWQPSADRV